MINETQGNLLAAPVEALVNTVNTVGVMGKGIALQFKRAFPENFAAYEAACQAGQVRVGQMFVVKNRTLSGPAWIINFPTKKHWRGKSKLEWIDSGLDDLIKTILELGIRSIAIPPLGAGNGGLEWPSVRELINRKLKPLTDVQVLLFPPSDAHREIAGAAVEMTWGRATLVRLIEAYAASRAATEPWSGGQGASALEIQKLMYFASLIAPSLGLGFKQGRYGPYSEQVRHLVQDMEGTFLRGYGDGASPVLKLEPIGPTREGSEQAEAFDASRSYAISRDIVEPTMRLLEGYEGPYELELLASVHWVRVRHDRPNDPDAITADVRKWSERKGRLFTRNHVERTIERLDERPVMGVLPSHSV